MSLFSAKKTPEERQALLANNISLAGQATANAKENKDLFDREKYNSDDLYKSKKNDPEYTSEVSNKVISKEYHLANLGRHDAQFIAKGATIAARFIRRGYVDTAERVMDYNNPILSISRGIGGWQQLRDNETNINTKTSFGQNKDGSIISEK